MPLKPTTEQALLRLRLDADLGDDVKDAIDQAHGQAEKYLDGPLVETIDADSDPKAVLCTPDIIAAQLLLVDVLVGANDVKAQESKRSAAYNMLRPHRNQGT